MIHRWECGNIIVNIPNKNIHRIITKKLKFKKMLKKCGKPLETLLSCTKMWITFYNVEKCLKSPILQFQWSFRIVCGEKKQVIHSLSTKCGKLFHVKTVFHISTLFVWKTVFYFLPASLKIFMKIIKIQRFSWLKALVCV